ncbi:hypothetical protein CAPTEDRAFT_97586 [Capitella teleta]|uniref:Alpha-(1,6)-fucosyltransferase n=1 Tax=Capitella teleta TaxID=283909 RepID=R7UEM1_CAPTE|nr:hypothetical protein CAPTEDRAFT_97586 [Capitella teleta]|eukprot:ELU04531.1 hypothetical protein CAPTEDRAFT_97586 [Capitella teleta]
MRGTWRVVAGLLVFWLLVLLYMSATLFQGGSDSTADRTERQLSRALHELDLLKHQNQELHELAEQLKQIQNNPVLGATADPTKEIQALKVQLAEARKQVHNLQKRSNAPPSLAQEELRRKVETGVNEMWYLVRSQLGQLRDEVMQNQAAQASLRVQGLMEDAADHRRVLLTDLSNLSRANGMDEWRHREHEQLTELVQTRIKYLQNPKDCSKAKKLVCNINKGCGYGCQLHHLTYCFIIAYGTQRTFVLESRGWRYSSEGWEKYFLPLSETCTDRQGDSSRAWGGKKRLTYVQVVDLPIVDSLHPRPPFMPQAIPADLAPRLMRMHGHPFVWWIAQFLTYLTRLQPAFQRDIDDVSHSLGFKGPIVGVHVRRTDKVGTEAAFHGLDEYMIYVEEYFNLLEKSQSIEQRAIYLATDDPNLHTEAKTKYPNYKIIGESEFSKSAGLSSRYTDNALRAIIMDIHFLSHSDYLVCTFSSQVCRVAYEVMQTLHPDASARFKSLDDIYYFGGQNGHSQMAAYPHEPRSGSDEMQLVTGDHVGIAGNHWDGYSKGNNRRTGKTGLFPSYKMVEDVEIVDFPTYPEATPQRGGGSR